MRLEPHFSVPWAVLSASSLKHCVFSASCQGLSVATNGMLVQHADGKTRTTALATDNGQPTAVWTAPGMTLLGYSSGLVSMMTSAGVADYRFHTGPVMQILLRDRTLWLLYESSVVVKIADLGEFMKLPEGLTYPAVRKYRLEGRVMRIMPLKESSLAAVGTKPMIQVVEDLAYFEGDIIADELDALKIKAKLTAAQMSSTVSSFAKSLWSRQSPEAGAPAVSEKPMALVADKRSIKIDADVEMDDEERTLDGVDRSGGHLLVTDSFYGRFLLYDMFAGLFCRQWKGYRGGQAVFVDDQTALMTAPRQRFIELRDVIKDERTAKLSLGDAHPDVTEFSLLDSTFVACSAADKLHVYRIVL